MNKTRVYVYGTLRPGNTPTVVVPGTIYDLGWFPGIKLGDGETICEVIEVDQAGLKRLDQYEGYDPRWPEDSLYVRKPFEDGFIYEYNNSIDDKKVVVSGDWLVHTNEASGRNYQLGDC